MKREFLLASAKAQGAWIAMILVLFALPTSVVFGARTVLPTTTTANPKIAITEDQEIPNWDPPLDPEFSKWDNAPVTYTPTHGAVEQGRLPECKTCPPDETNYNKPDVSLDPLWPASPTVKIVAEWPSGDLSDCSGVLVDSSAVLTAGHCVFTHTAAFCEGSESCWVADLTISLKPGSPEEITSGFTQILTWTAWTENRDFNYDLAGIQLANPLGNIVGWLGFGYNYDNQFFAKNTFSHMSYVDLTLTSWSAPFNLIDDHRFYSNSGSIYGQAGAGAHSNADNHILHSVLSHHRDFEGVTKTGHTRITPDKFFALRDWINGGIKKMNFIYYLPIFPE